MKKSEKIIRQPLALAAKRVGQCKICKLADTDSDFLMYLYQLRFGLNLSLRMVASLANQMLKEHSERSGRKLPEINEANLSVHFNRHVPIDLVTKYRMQVETSAGRTGTNAYKAHEASKELVQQYAEGENNELNLFQNLLNLYESIKKQYEEMMENMEPGKYNKASYPLASQMTKILVELNKMKQSEKIIGVILNALLSQVSERLVMVALSELELTKLLLGEFIDKTEDRDKIINDLRARLGNGFVEAITTALEDVKSKFPIAVLN